MAEKLGQDPEQMLRAMAQSELGLSEQSFPNPWKSSASAAISTAVGAFIPIIPFFFLNGFTAVRWISLISAIFVRGPIGWHRANIKSAFFAGCGARWNRDFPWPR